jgi:hypothetical protein
VTAGQPITEIVRGEGRPPRPVLPGPHFDGEVLRMFDVLERRLADLEQTTARLADMLDRVVPLLDEFAPVLEQVRARMSKGSWKQRFASGGNDE